MKQDVADFYQERSFAGRKLIAVGIAPFLLYFAVSSVVRVSELDGPAPIIFGFILWTGLVCYLIGYWKAIKAKGYPRILWIASFTGPIGLALILLLPHRNDTN